MLVAVALVIVPVVLAAQGRQGGKGGRAVPLAARHGPLAAPVDLTG